MEISAGMVKELRGKTGCGIMDCKAALKECDGDMEKAIDFLRKKGLAAAQKRAGRATAEGLVHAYIHQGGKIGVLVEVNCETDFVAKSDAFKELVNNIAMHIAASAPAGLNQEDIPADLIEREREVYKGQVLESGKPENMIDKIVEGKMNKFFKDNCLMTQPYIRDPKTTIQDLLTDAVAKLGENIQIRQFARFQLGD
ncbi:MAG: translation elongation factor Ts [Deltaproteobacteria bacterium]|nr:MAG: translation elongation factor Ts [Deltaproteobacteria bacterium]